MVSVVRAVALLLGVSAVFPAGPPDGALLWGQDVELLGEQYGTRPPPAYYQELEADPQAFQFHREGLERLYHLLQSRDGWELEPRFQLQGPAGSPIGPRDEAVEGEFPIPLVLGLFQDTPEAPFASEEIHREFFEGPSSRHQTVTEYYREMSDGRAEVLGVTSEWIETELTREEVTGGNSGLSSEPGSQVAAFIEAMVAALDEEGMDWSRFDHTGDGFVDILTVMHPTPGAECQIREDWPDEWKDRDSLVWSHRWNVASASGGRLNPGIPTRTPHPDGNGPIYIRDYTIQPAYSCTGTAVNEIGVYAHELGHAFGLPDLYSTSSSSQHRGSGNWDLMGTGTWGCQGGSPARPCAMGAWSRKMLGWVDVEVMDPDRDHGTVRLPPTLSSNRVLRLDSGEDSGEYLLLENRQRMGADEAVFHSGLLVWHVDPEVVDARWRFNSVNNDPDRMGVWIRQADGSNSLAEPGGGRGSSGDPFPGCPRESLGAPCGDPNREFHVASEPGSRSHAGYPMGLTLLDIEEVGGEPHDVEFRLSTRFTRVTVGWEGESEAQVEVDSPLRLDGKEVPEAQYTFLSAPFQRHELEARSGLEWEEGIRSPFQGWSDGGARERTFTTGLADSLLVAEYGGTEVRVTVGLDSPVEGVEPGDVVLEPSSDGTWVPQGEEVEVEARPRTGFSFREWKGALTHQENPALLTADAPVSLEATFDLIYGVPDAPEEVELEAAHSYEVTFQVENANEPVEWAVVEGSLPEGIELNAAEGVLAGAAMEDGSFPVELRVRDDIGLEAAVPLTLEVTPPRITEEELVGPFMGTGEAPTPLQQEYLDRNGNGSGSYDIGDLRVHLQRVDGLPTASRTPGAVRLLVPVGPLTPPDEDGGDPGSGGDP